MNYYSAKDLPRFSDVGKDAPELWAKFLGWYSAVFAEKGATPEQMTEAVHVAAAIRGGASLVHAVQMRNHLEKLSM
jgi:hypothetical protein